MKVELSTLLIILGCALVTFLPRILPFVVVRNLDLPKPLLKWLSYIPVCLLTALVVQGVMDPNTKTTPALDWISLAAIVPTLLVAIRTKSLLATVITGVSSVAFIQWII